MTKEFNLSEKMFVELKHNVTMILAEDVKEFIKNLKYEPCPDFMKEKIDKLTGEELSK